MMFSCYDKVCLSVFRGKSYSMTLLTLEVYIDPQEDVETLSLLVDEMALRLYEKKIRTEAGDAAPNR